MRAEDMQPPVPNQEAMRQHVDHLFLDSMHGLVELAWTDPGDGAPKHAQLFEIDRLDELVEKAVALNGERRNVYLGAALRKETTPPFGRSNGVDFLAATAVWSDLDDPGGTVRAAEVYKQLGTPPTLVVVTGATPHQRAQLWWKLDEPALEATVVKALLGGAQRTLGGDAAVVDPARIMRLGGSVAWPTKSGRIAELTQVLLFRDRPAYGVARLAAAFPTARREADAEPGARHRQRRRRRRRTDRGRRLRSLAPQYLAAGGSLGRPRLVRWRDPSRPRLTLPATVEQTRAELAPLIAGARSKWKKPNSSIQVEGGE